MTTDIVRELAPKPQRPRPAIRFGQPCLQCPRTAWLEELLADGSLVLLCPNGHLRIVPDEGRSA